MRDPKKPKDMDYVLGRGEPQEKGQQSFVAKYHCARCDFLFEFNPTLRKTVRCPVCRGTKCVPKSPGVHVHRKVEVDGRALKRRRMQLRNIKLMRQMTECRNLFLTYLRSIGVKEECAKEASIAMDVALKEAREVAERSLLQF
jgi:hypothetical protein